MPRLALETNLLAYNNKNIFFERRRVGNLPLYYGKSKPCGKDRVSGKKGLDKNSYREHGIS